MGRGSPRWILSLLAFFLAAFFFLEAASPAEVLAVRPSGDLFFRSSRNETMLRRAHSGSRCGSRRRQSSPSRSRSASHRHRLRPPRQGAVRGLIQTTARTGSIAPTVVARCGDAVRWRAYSIVVAPWRAVRTRGSATPPSRYTRSSSPTSADDTAGDASRPRWPQSVPDHARKRQ